MFHPFVYSFPCWDLLILWRKTPAARGNIEPVPRETIALPLNAVMWFWRRELFQFFGKVIKEHKDMRKPYFQLAATSCIWSAAWNQEQPQSIRAREHRLARGGRGLVWDIGTYQSVTLTLCPVQDILQTTKCSHSTLHQLKNKEREII